MSQVLFGLNLESRPLPTALGRPKVSPASFIFLQSADTGDMRWFICTSSASSVA